MTDEKIIGYINDGVYVINDGFRDESDEKDYVKNVPVFDGGEYNGIYASGDSAFIVCINNTNKDEILSYAEKLEKSGYKISASNKISENLYYTFQNGDAIVTAYYIEPLKSVKIIAEPYYEYFTDIKEEDKVKPAIVASSACDRNFYVRLPNNRLVVIDGGWRVEDWAINDYKDLLNQMYNEMSEILGGAEKIEIPLWIITHAHSDHAKVLEYLHTLPLKEKFNISQIIYNFPADNHFVPEEDKTEQHIKSTKEFALWHEKAGKEFPYERIFYNCPFPVFDTYKYERTCRESFKKYGAVQIKAHTGMKFNLSGVVFEVLHTPEDDMPFMFDNKNNTSIIIKMTYKGSPMLWLGDMGEVPSTSCVKMYGDFLKSDAMQVSHHGWGAATPEFYDIVRPSVLFWNNSEFGFKYSDKYQGYGKTKTSTDLYNMDSVKRNFFCNRIRMSYAYLPVKIKNNISQNGGCKIISSAVSDRTFYIRLENGKLIVLGGSFRDEAIKEFGIEKLIEKLCAEMAELSGNEKVNIAAWVVSNMSPDNNRFIENISEACLKDKINIEKIIYNFPKTDTIYDENISADYHEFLLNRFKQTGAELIVANNGMKLGFDGIQCEILYAPCEENFRSVADTSLVLRFVSGDGSAIFTGDMTDSISQKLIEKYGDRLKCDAVQVANHGFDNCGVVKFYELCAAGLQLWNNSEYGYRFFNKTEGYKKSPNSTEIFGLKTCKLNVFCDEVKPRIMSFPLNDDELQYDV